MLKTLSPDSFGLFSVSFFHYENSHYYYGILKNTHIMEQKLFMVLMRTEDGDSYNIHTKQDTAQSNFEEECDNNIHTEVLLLELEEGKEFGFGSYGDVYGASVIDSYE